MFSVHHEHEIIRDVTRDADSRRWESSGLLSLEADKSYVIRAVSIFIIVCEKLCYSITI